MRELVDLISRAALTPADPDRLDQADRALMAETARVVDAACRAWFDLEVRGTEHLPDGPALVVGNHNSGITFVEALGWGARLFLEGHMTGDWHGLAHDSVVDMPLLGNFLVRVGAVRATHANADAAFRDGHKIVVFPGGNPEAFRVWKERGRVRFEGRKGFLKLALRHGVPIVPVVFHGGHDGFRVLAENRWLARATGARKLLRTEVWPLYAGLPWGLMLGPVFHLPLPVKVVTRILPPIPLDGYSAADAEDPVVLQSLYDHVTATMQRALDELAAEVPEPLRGAGRRLRRTLRLVTPARVPTPRPWVSAHGES